MLKKLDRGTIESIFVQLISGFRKGVVDVDGAKAYDRIDVVFLEDEKAGSDIVIESDEPEEYVPKLIIKNRDEFYNKLLEFAITVDEEIMPFTRIPPNLEDINREFEVDRVVGLIYTIWYDATPQDFGDPVSFLDRYIKFIKDKTFANLNKGVTIGGITLKDMRVGITSQNVAQRSDMETPYCLEFCVTGADKQGIPYEKYVLPRVMYGIEVLESGEKVGYIYAVQGERNYDRENPLYKNFNRYIHRLQDSVLEQEAPEYRAYAKKKQELLGLKDLIDSCIRQGRYYGTAKQEELEAKQRRVEAELEVLEQKASSYENITELSPQFVISMSLAIAMMRKAGVSTIKVPDLLLRRYKNKEMSRSTDYADEIQSRCTNQLIRAYRRVEFHIENMFRRVSYPMEEEESFGILRLNPDTNAWRADSDLLQQFIDMITNNPNLILDEQQLEI